MNTDLSPIINAFIALLAAVITVYILPWIKAKIGNEKFTALKAWVAVAVSAAEKLFNYSSAGAEKKAYVKKFIESLGLKIDSESLDNIIESEVYKLTQEGA